MVVEKCSDILVAVVQYKFTQEQYTEQHNETEHTERNMHNIKYGPIQVSSSVITAGFSCTDLPFSRKVEALILQFANQIIISKFLQCYKFPADFMVDCTAIPLRTKGTSFQIGPKHRVSLVSVSWVSSIHRVRIIWPPYTFFIFTVH
jgi:hypothetical protein